MKSCSWCNFSFFLLSVLLCCCTFVLMLADNPYKVFAKRVRRRFKVDAVGTAPVETYNIKTGEVRSATQLVGSHKVYDSSDFVKLYDLGCLIGLSPCAVAVFCFLVSRLRFGGYAVFNYKDCLLYTHYESRQSVYRGLLELEKRDVIRRRSKHEWWINPNCVYRGQRDEFEILNKKTDL